MTGRKLGGVCLALVCAWGLRPQPAFAQATVNPTKAVFDQSADHNATNSDGTPVVQSYQLGFYLVGASAPFQTNSLGKPTPDSAGTITVDLTSMLVGWPVPGTNYFAEVKAIGAGGTSAGAQSNTFSFVSTCTYSIAPASQSVVASGSSATVSVTAPAGCAWTAASNAAWVTITSGLAGTGNGTVGYTVASNALTSARTGTLTIAGKTFTINQAAAPCSYSLSPTSQTVSSAGATRTTTVSATSGCSWTAVSNASWITVSGGSSGTGNGTVTYVIAANTGASRTGTLTIAGQTVTINESAPSAQPSAPRNLVITQ